jgi:hypothetical protein
MIPNKKFKYGSQNFRLLEALNCGPVTTDQLLYQLRFGSHVRRMKDVRDYLETIGFTIITKQINCKCFEYHIETIKPSWFYWLKGLFQQRQGQEG